MTHAVFFSWQSDLPETRNTVQGALERAVRNLNTARSLEVELRVDQDAGGIAGWPEITQTILKKIEQCEIVVADITPVTGIHSGYRLSPNPNVMLELGYALATGLGRTRIICVVNSVYLPQGDLKHLPFDVRGSRPLTFSLSDRATRGVVAGQEDPVGNSERANLSKRLERALDTVLNAIQVDRANRLLNLTPHLVTDKLERFQVVIEAGSLAPFEATYSITEPSGNLLSGFMLHPARLAPDGVNPVRFRSETLKPLTPGNDIYVLSGRVGHVPTEGNPVPLSHPFEVRYQVAGDGLTEIHRVQIPVH